MVVDNGSGTIKAGFSGDDCPRAVFPTIMGCFPPGSLFDSVDCIVSQWTNHQAIAKTVVTSIEHCMVRYKVYVTLLLRAHTRT